MSMDVGVPRRDMVVRLGNFLSGVFSRLLVDYRVHYVD